MNEPAIDLALVLAIISSYQDKPIDEKTIVFGEVGLSGEVRAVSQASQRVIEAKTLGFHRVILPKESADAMEPVEGIVLTGVSTVMDALRSIS